MFNKLKKKLKIYIYCMNNWLSVTQMNRFILGSANNSSLRAKMYQVGH